MSIIAENLSKTFLIKNSKYENHTTLRDRLGFGIKNLFEENISSQKKEFTALDSINFEIKKGEKVALLGQNGAGKSTLLKILSRIISPTTGKVTINGKISSLIEVGTGFHLELNAAENILLSGTILGMTRKEINSKFDEIVEFSEIKDYLYVPVKRFSSGMQIKLGFSVAAHLIADILILDEVLALGDLSFQEKCIKKINQISNSGRTLIYVSHDIKNINNICDKGILLDSGKIVFQGPINEVVEKYKNVR